MPEYTVKTDVPSKLNYPFPTEGQKTYSLTFGEDGLSLKEANSFDSFYSTIVHAHNRVGIAPGDVGKIKWDLAKTNTMGNWSDEANVPVSIDATNEETITLQPGFLYEIEVQMHTNLDQDGDSRFTYFPSDTATDTRLPFSTIGIAASITFDTTEEKLEIYSPVTSTALVEVKGAPKEIDIKYTVLHLTSPDTEWEYTDASFLKIQTVRPV